MFGASNVPSVADIAAVTDNRNDMGFGGNWWVIILLLFLFGGFNRGGAWGNNGDCCGQPATCSDLQRGFDNQSVMNKLNGLENGMCSMAYDQLSQFNGVNQNINGAAWGLERSIQQMGVANMQDTYALSRQLGDCCCENRLAISQIRNDMAADTCAITTALNQMGQNIMINDNNNYRQLHDEFVSFQMQAKDEKIAEQASLINALNLAQSQANQNQYLISQLRPSPQPCYPVQNPYASVNWGNNCGCNNACGCGC